MPVLNPQDPMLGNTGEEYTSPFPSEEALANEQYAAILKRVGTLPGLSAEGILAADQAAAWDRAQRVLLRRAWTSRIAGGIPTEMYSRVGGLVDVGGFEVVTGIFAGVDFPASTNVNAMQNAAIEVGLNIAQNAISAVPIVGGILSGAIGAGRWVAKLAMKSKAEVVLRIPWVEYQRESDQDAINGLIGPMMGGVDWTPIFEPAIAAGNFRMEKTRRGGPTRALGVFGPDGTTDYTGGVGFMPGTQRLTSVVQVAQTNKPGLDRVDAVTDIGSFWQSVSQFASGAWEMVNKSGAPAMYKVRAGELGPAWREYFNALFAGAFDQWDDYAVLKVDDIENRLFLSKLLSPFIIATNPQGHETFGLDVSRIGIYITPDIFSGDFRPFVPGTTYARPDARFILPATRRLKERQKAMLARSVVSALVRPVDLQGLPRFAAFRDSSPALSPGYATFGEELTAYALEMREILLTHPARYELAQTVPGSINFEKYAPDVRDVDPAFADRLEATLVPGLPLRARSPLGFRPLDPNAASDPAALPPGGGPVHGPGDQRGWLARNAPALGAGLAVAGGIGLATWRYR